MRFIHSWRGELVHRHEILQFQSMPAGYVRVRVATLAKPH